jgi:hypothetical protein
MPLRWAETERPDAKDPATFTETLELTKRNARWKREPHAVLGRLMFNDSNGAREWVCRIHRIPLGLFSGTRGDIQNYLNKGFIVLEYWIPGMSDTQRAERHGDLLVEHGWVAEAKTHEGRERLEDLRKFLDACLYGNKHELEQRAKIKALEEKLSQAEARLGKKAPASI